MPQAFNYNMKSLVEAELQNYKFSKLAWQGTNMLAEKRKPKVDTIKK